jgi:hypothetical protein
MPEVESVDLVMGPVDLMVRLRVRDQEAGPGRLLP